MTGANETLLTVSDELAGAVERVASAIVTVHAGDRRPASGVIWSEGVVVTAAHAVRREEGIELRLADGSRAAADLAGLDAGTDLAVVKCGAARSAALERADLDALKVGQLAVAVARLSDHGVNASLGIIGGLGNAWRTWRGGTVEQLIRVAMSLYPGFSGGALLDARGRIVGINTAGLSRSGSIALPNTTVERVTAELLARGFVARPYLGVAMQSVRLPKSLQSKLELDDGAGVIVMAMEPEGPAERAGVLVGDIFLRVGGERVTDAADVQHALGAVRLAGTVSATVVRGGELAVLDIAPGERRPRSP
jgi:S1-C subfamily serine protease